MHLGGEEGNGPGKELFFATKADSNDFQSICVVDLFICHILCIPSHRSPVTGLFVPFIFSNCRKIHDFWMLIFLFCRIKYIVID